MRYSKLPFRSKKDVAKDDQIESSVLFEKAGFLTKHAAGIFTLNTFSLLAMQKLEGLIRRELAKIDAYEVRMPFVQPLNLWDKSGRSSSMGDEFLTFEDRKKAALCLGPTHEEVIVDVASHFVHSYKQLPFCLFQIGLKFRDERRPRFGLMRAREFQMMDAYSFHESEQGLSSYYEEMKQAYRNIFDACSFDYAVVEADSGAIGGSKNHEFHLLSENGEDELCTCSKCGFVSNSELWATGKDEKKCPSCVSADFEVKRGIEIGHIFELGDKYSKAMELSVQGADSKTITPVMGCYGIGVSRILAACCEVFQTTGDKDQGFLWPDILSPFSFVIVDLTKGDRAVEDFYNQAKLTHQVLWDDRKKEGFGHKLADVSLCGLRYAVIMGRDFLKDKTTELWDRRENTRTQLSLKELQQKFNIK